MKKNLGLYILFLMCCWSVVSLAMDPEKKAKLAELAAVADSAHAEYDAARSALARRALEHHVANPVSLAPSVVRDDTNDGVEEPDEVVASSWGDKFSWILCTLGAAVAGFLSADAAIRLTHKK